VEVVVRDVTLSWSIGINRWARHPTCSMTIEARLTFATELIREAGKLAAGYFAHRATLRRETKGPHDFVSIADREVEALIRTRLAEAFPERGWLSRGGERWRGTGAVLGGRSD